MSLPPELSRIRDEVRVHAVDYGLDFFEVIFEVLDWKQINEVAAFGGFPNRYPHWRFGMDYERLSKSYAYGLSKIYEMVINNDPCYAYLLHSNHLVDQKMVMAHVYGHSDFFKRNQYFSYTNRKMMDEMANHRTRVLRYIDRYGVEKVETFIDACLSLETLIDYHSPAIKRMPALHAVGSPDEHQPAVSKLGGHIKPYMERYINPPEFLEAQRKRQEAEHLKESHFPETPQRGVLQFLLQYAPMESWERDILSIINEEAHYFAPQGQTKIMNEGWACVTGDTRILTEHGAIPARELVEQKKTVRVFDGTTWRRIIDWAHFPARNTVRIRTRRGLVLEGSASHQILTSADQELWKRLDAVQLGDRIELSGGDAAWPIGYHAIAWQPERRTTLENIAAQVGVNISTVIRHRQGTHVSRSAAALSGALAHYDAQPATALAAIASRQPITIPEYFDERLAQFLGYLTGDGHISVVKRVLGLTTADDEPRDTFAALAQALFGLTAKIRKDENRWRVLLHSQDLRDFLQSLGMSTGVSAREKNVPQLIWRSPRSVVCAWLQAYFDCDGYAGRQGVILSTFSAALAEGVQQLLLRLNILSRRRRAGEGWHVHVTGHGAQIFEALVGFGICRKQRALREYLASHQQWKREDWDDEIVEIQHGKQDVYDFTVEETHRYVAHGLVNHNSFWHSKIMTQRVLKDSEVIDYADHHSGTVAMSPGNFNPYKVGIELFRDIEERWNKGRFGKEYNECTDMRARANWDRNLGLGREKIFEVRTIYNDVTFIDEFLTAEFCQRHKLFVYAYNITTEQYEVASHTFDKIKQQLLFQLTNCGNPQLAVVDANYHNRGELVIKHTHEGMDLRPDYAQETLKSLFMVWRRPVHVETLVDGLPRFLSFDGEQYKEQKP